MMGLDGIKAVVDAELVMEWGTAEAIVEDVAGAVAVRLAMAVMVLMESPPDLKDVYTVRLMVPPMMMMMQCSSRIT